MIRSIFVSSSFRSSVPKSFNKLILELGGRYHVSIKLALSLVFEFQILNCLE